MSLFNRRIFSKKSATFGDPALNVHLLFLIMAGDIILAVPTYQE